VPVLPISKVPASGHDEKSGANRLAEESSWPVATSSSLVSWHIVLEITYVYFFAGFIFQNI